MTWDHFIHITASKMIINSNFIQKIISFFMPFRFYRFIFLFFYIEFGFTNYVITTYSYTLACLCLCMWKVLYAKALGRHKMDVGSLTFFMWKTSNEWKKKKTNCSNKWNRWRIWRRRRRSRKMGIDMRKRGQLRAHKCILLDTHTHTHTHWWFFNAYKLSSGMLHICTRTIQFIK